MFVFSETGTVCIPAWLGTLYRGEAGLVLAEILPAASVHLNDRHALAHRTYCSSLDFACCCCLVCLGQSFAVGVQDSLKLGTALLLPSKTENADMYRYACFTVLFFF